MDPQNQAAMDALNAAPVTAGPPDNSSAMNALNAATPQGGASGVGPPVGGTPAPGGAPPIAPNPSSRVGGAVGDVVSGLGNMAGINPEQALNPDARSMSSDVLGYGSVAQLPGRVMAIPGQVATAMGLDESRGKLAELNLALIRALPGVMDPQRRAVLEQQVHDNMTLMDAMNQQARGVEAGELSGEEVAAAAGKAALTTLLAGGALSELGNAGLGGKLLKGAAIGGPALALNAASENAPAPDVLKAAAAGSAFGSILEGALAAGKAFLIKGLPNLLQYTSSVPASLLSREGTNAGGVETANAVLQKDGEMGVLQKVQGAVQQQRKVLSAEWDAGAKALAGQYQTPFDMSGAIPGSRALGLFSEYGLQPPPNVKAMTVQDVLGFNKELNSMLTGKASYSPDFADLRDFRIAWQNEMTKQGDLGNGVNPLQTFLENYGAKADIVNGMNSLVPSLGHNAQVNPKIQQRALNLLSNGATMNKSAFLDAIQQFEKLSGFPVRDYMEALQTKSIVPPAGFGKSKLLNFFQTILGGPKGAAFLSKVGSTIANAPGVGEAGSNILKEAAIGSGSVGPALGAAAIGAGAVGATAANAAQNIAAPIENLGNPPAQPQQ